MAISEATWARDLYDYNPETGQFLWRNPPKKAGRSKAMPGKPAGTVDNRSGSLLLRLGGKLHQASQVAWLYVHGEWPERQVHFKDASLPLPAKNRLENLRLVGAAEDVTADNVRQVLRYDAETGDFFWLVKRRGAVSGAPAGSIKKIGGKLTRYIRFAGSEHSAGRLAWLLHYGEWPKQRLEFKDGNAANTRIENITEGRFAHGTRQDEPLTQEERQKRRSATFRRHDLRRSYGLTDDEREAMSVAQEHRCASCGGPQKARYRGRLRPLAIDHDHSLGNCREAVRGLLCNACNGAMGYVKDDIERLMRVLIYRAHWARDGELAEILPLAEELVSICQHGVARNAA